MREVILSGGPGRSLHCNLALALLGVRVLPAHCYVKVRLLFMLLGVPGQLLEKRVDDAVGTRQHQGSVPGLRPSCGCLARDGKPVRAGDVSSVATCNHSSGNRPYDEITHSRSVER